jgi:hypothetical protein
MQLLQNFYGGNRKHLTQLLWRTVAKTASKTLGGNLNFEPPVGRNVIPSANARLARTEGFRRETFELTSLGSLDLRSG